MTPAGATTGPVLVVGTGLIGTSIALGLRSRGVSVFLDDPSPTTLALACDMGAGVPLASGEESPVLVVIAAPPDVSGPLVAGALRDYPEATVTDVASVKSEILAEVLADVGPEAAARYVGSHPMAGRSHSGAAYADSDLFLGRPWVIAAPEGANPHSVLAVRGLVVDLGAVPIEMDAAGHDQAVAYVSHVPQLVSSLLAARLLDAPAEALCLAGQGLRDTTRIAASDPKLWAAIVAGNAAPIAQVLSSLATDLNSLVDSLRDYDLHETLISGAIGKVSQTIAAGNLGVARIPGKHGSVRRNWAELEVMVPDQPGELGRLFTELGEAEVNIEDLSLEHSPGNNFGLARLLIDPGVLPQAIEELEERGWRTLSGKAQHD